MDDYKLKDAFQKVKQDIFDLQSQISSLSQDMSEVKSLLNELISQESIQQTDTQQTNSQVFPTQKLNELSSYSPETLKSQNKQFSTGNEGVPTDRQTNQQTDRQEENPSFYTQESTFQQIPTYQKPELNELSNLSQTLESLNLIKNELKTKFSHLTNQEFLVFSTIYQLENSNFIVDYPLLASKLKLSESSIRDYIIKINRKGITISKIKENNKKIFLKIPEELRKIAPLQAILALKYP